MPCLRLFRSEEKGLSPEERLVLASFVMHFEGYEALRMTLRELSERLGISLRVVSRAVSKLAAEAYLVVDKVSTGRGRPSSTYKLSAALRAHLSELDGENCPSVCAQAIKNLLSERNEKNDQGDCAKKKIGLKKPPGKSKADQPSASSRWLLAVLFSYADELGVVRDVTTSQLRQITGMGGVRLKSQLQGLLARGLIRSYVPGASNTLFVGVKLSTTYFLNLNHPFLGLGRDVCSVLALKDFGWNQREAVCATALPVVERYLRAIEEQAFNVFCMRLDAYASFLLSNRWVELSNPDFPEMAKSLEKMIAADFQRPNGSAGAGTAINESDWAIVIEHIGWLALENVRWIRKILMRMPSGGTCNTRIQIIPAPKKKDKARITTLLMERSLIPQASCLVIKYVTPRVCELYREEAEIPIGERYELGLLTRSRDRA